MKILIATPNKGDMTPRYVLSLVNLVKNLDIDFEYIIELGTDVPSKRCAIAERALKIGASHIFFIDSDMTWSNLDNPLKKLLLRDKDIIGVGYNFKRLPLESTMTPLQTTNDGLIRCKYLPTGFMIIKTEVFEKLEKPWFMFEHDSSGQITKSEDVYFCEKAINAGFDIWCDQSIKVGHVGEYIF